ncbi:hypothetical protein [Haloplanus sp.]|uniref:hypothetical protein n=1 Tax=Haloplanus sp. TaxID=1961696 RepID=UPI002638695F|nr:hypothetical protein [Haloplanus sp.]
MTDSALLAAAVHAACLAVSYPVATALFVVTVAVAVAVIHTRYAWGADRLPTDPHAVEANPSDGR